MKKVRYKSAYSGQVVEVSMAHVKYKGDGTLPPDIAWAFIQAADEEGGELQKRLARVQELRERNPEIMQLAQAEHDSPIALPGWATEPQPHVHIVPFDAVQPWPIFVDVGSEVVTEFYPENFAEQEAAFNRARTVAA